MTGPRFAFQPPDEDARPPAEVRLVDLAVQPYADGRRVRVLVELTSFQQPPNLEIQLSAADGEVVSLTHIIETAVAQLSFTMHIRSATAVGPFTAAVRLYYPDLDSVDERQVTFETPPASG
ncbi:MAG TPA: hypothetical protein PKG95_03295 [Anaerolineaceae bacterium]|jgi:hypothetical protein|nr:hypothetical protein [Anaerolineaceae bacterium]